MRSARQRRLSSTSGAYQASWTGSSLLGSQMWWRAMSPNVRSPPDNFSQVGRLPPMRFRRGASLDTGQIEDRRGMGGGRGLAVGGGGAGLLVVLLIALL